MAEKCVFQSRKNCQGIRDLQSVNNANTLVIEDDHFLSDNDRAKGVLRIARELGLKCVFPNALALYGLDRSMLEVLSSCGVRQLTLAVESGSPRVLKLMKKPLRIDITERVAGTATKWEFTLQHHNRDARRDDG